MLGQAMPNRSDRLTMFALYALEDMTKDACELSSTDFVGPMPRTWSFRLVLGYLCMRGICSKDHATAIWQEMQSAGTEGNTAYTRSYCRHRTFEAFTEMCFRNAGAYRGRAERQPITAKKLHRVPPESKPSAPRMNPVEQYESHPLTDEERARYAEALEAMPKPRTVNPGSCRSDR